MRSSADTLRVRHHTCSLNNSSLAALLSRAGGSTTPSVLPVTDIKYDPIFSHPPPWANTEKIYAVVKQKSDNIPQSNFQVKKFDFKLFDKKEEKKIEEKKSEENKYDIIKKITKKTSRETTNDVQGMKTSEVLDKNLTENSQKYVNVNSEVNRRPETENIYDHVKSCDTIEVIAETDDTQVHNENDKSPGNPLSKVKTTSDRICKNSSKKTKQLKDKMVTIFSQIGKTNEAKTETNDGHCQEENSLVKRFMSKCKSSRISQKTRERVTSVKINGAENWKVFKSVQDKVGLKLKENKEDTEELEKAGLLKRMKAKVNSSVRRSEKKENPKLTSLKNRLSDFTKLKKNDGDNLENNKLKLLKSKFSVRGEQVKNLKCRVSSLRWKRTEEGNKSKTNERQKSFKCNFKFFDRVKSDNNPKKLLNNLKIKQNWSKMKNSKEFSKTVKKPKYSTSNSVKEKKTRFSDEISEDFTKLNTLQSTRSSTSGGSSFKYDTMSLARGSGKYKWNYIDGQWKKCDSIGL